MRKKIIFLELLFLILIYASGIYFRLIPRLSLDPHLLTFEADIWYRLTMAQNLMDHGHLPEFDIRYQAYGNIPFWYPPLSLYAFAALSKISHWDLPTVSSRIIPFFESIIPLSFYFLCRYLIGIFGAVAATIFLCLTPSFVFWTGISDPQSFILFMIPLALLFWIKHVEWTRSGNSKWGLRLFYCLLFGGALAVSFLTHIFFLLMAGIFFLTTLSLFLQKETRPPFSIWFDCIIILLLSQIFTAWWWFPKNLYWWWIKALVTSSGHYPPDKMLIDFGSVAAIIGIYFFFYLLIKAVFKNKGVIRWAWIPFFWGIVPLLETQNENILALFGRMDLSWSTLYKPLEGFRFYAFCGQPLALAFGMITAYFYGQSELSNTSWKKKLLLFQLPLIYALLFADMKLGYNFTARIQNSGFTMEEIKAAQWFREHSKPTDRIVADYYRSYMFAGFSGGRALLGIAFPLKNVDMSYISQKNYTVPDDIYRMYTTDDPHETVALMERYGATHLLITANMGSTGNFITKGFGVPYNFKTLQDGRFFKTVYQEQGKVVILEKIKSSKNP